MKHVLVTGANGQLGKCLKDASSQFNDCDFLFCAKDDLDLNNQEDLTKIFNENTFDYCINTAAYTNVEKAESDRDAAFKTNALAVKSLAAICKKSNTTLLHVSTDYVFDGKKGIPYTEEDRTNPINIYGASKLKGEEYIIESGVNHFIFRTSWLYSQHGHNFLNTMLNYGKEGKSLTITTEQKGTPTNANDLALALLQVIASANTNYGIYNYSNSGVATWYDFAKAIFEENPDFDITNLGKTDYYRTFAARPEYSVLNTEKYKETFNNNVIDWRESLSRLLN